MEPSAVVHGSLLHGCYMAAASVDRPGVNAPSKLRWLPAEVSPVCTWAYVSCEIAWYGRCSRACSFYVHSSEPTDRHNRSISHRKFTRWVSQTILSRPYTHYQQV